MSEDIAALIDRLEATRGADLKLDVLVEIALFTPNTIEASIRSNAAGTKVICTDQLGKDTTYCPDDWTMFDRRAATIQQLRSRAHLLARENGGAK